MGTYECLLQKTGFGTPSMDHAAVAYQEDKDGTAQKYPVDAPIWKYPRVVHGEDHLLYALFEADDVSFTDVQVLDSAVEGVATGSLTTHELLDGLAIASEQLTIPKFSAGGYMSGVLTTDDITPELGVAFIAEISRPTASGDHGSALVILDSATTRSTLVQTNIVAGFGVRSGGTLVALTNNIGTSTTIPEVDIVTSDDTMYPVAIVWGGFDSTGVPYQSGDTKADFSYGCSYFYYDGSNWLLYGKFLDPNITNDLSVGLLNLATNTSGANALANSIRQPDFDFASLLEPVFLDLFDGVDNTHIMDHVPDINPESASWENYSTQYQPRILNNNVSGSSSNVIASAVIDTGMADCVLVMPCQYYRSGSVSGNSGFIVRAVDSNNYFEVILSTTSTSPWTFVIKEKTGGSYTTRATGTGMDSGTPGNLGAVTLIARLTGSTIEFLVMGEEYTLSIKYESATQGQTSGKHGFRLYSQNLTVAPAYIYSFAAYPNGVSGDYAALALGAGTAYADNGSGTLLDPQPYLSSQAFSDVSLTTPVTVPAIWDSANRNNTEGGYYCEIEYDGDDVNILLNDDVAILYVTSDVLYLDDGTNTISNAITTGEHQIGIAWETDTSEMDLCLNGTWYGSSDAYDGSFGTGDLSTEATIRELQGITGDLTTSKAAIDALMP